MDHPEISETAVHFSPLHHALSDLQGAVSVSKKQNPAFNFFLLFSTISDFFPCFTI